MPTFAFVLMSLVLGSMCLMVVFIMTDLWGWMRDRVGWYRPIWSSNSVLLAVDRDADGSISSLVFTGYENGVPPWPRGSR